MCEDEIGYEFCAKFELHQKVFFKKHETGEVTQSTVTGVIFNIHHGYDTPAYYQLNGEVSEYTEDELFGSVEVMYRSRSPEIQKKIAKHKRELVAMLRELEEMEGELNETN